MGQSMVAARRVVVIVAAVSLACSIPGNAAARGDGIPATESTAARSFLRMLQRALEMDDSRTVADLIRYPIRVNAGLAIPVRDRAAFLPLYRVFFGTELRCGIVNSSIGGNGRRGLPVSVTLEGISIGRNLRAEMIGSRFLITGMTAMPDSAVPSRRRPSERITLRAGERKVSGALDRNDTQSYVVWADRNRTLQARLEGFRGRDAVVRVLDAQGHAVAGRESRVWSGQVPKEGDYHIEVVRRAPFCAPTLTYVLTVVVR